MLFVDIPGIIQSSLPPKSPESNEDVVSGRLSVDRSLLHDLPFIFRSIKDQLISDVFHSSQSIRAIGDRIGARQSGRETFQRRLEIVDHGLRKGCGIIGRACIIGNDFPNPFVDKDSLRIGASCDVGLPPIVSDRIVRGR